MLSAPTYSFFFVRVEPNTPSQDEPKFIVFYSSLIALFSVFCFQCKSENPKVKLEQNGTMVTVKQHCSTCCKSFTWRSQPYLFGRYPAGNILLSFSVLMAGVSISKVLLLFRHMGLLAYTQRTFFYHQRKFLFPTILKYWESYQAAMVNTLKNLAAETVWCGDGRFDSMGHSAKYGAYTMFCCTIMKIVHFELLQVCLSLVIQKALQLDLNFIFQPLTVTYLVFTLYLSLQCFVFSQTKLDQAMPWSWQGQNPALISS